MTDKITVRDDKLFKREAYIRRERYVCIALSVICLLGVLGTAVSEFIPESTGRGGLLAILCLLGYAYYCTLLIRHIESIKTFRSQNANR